TSFLLCMGLFSTFLWEAPARRLHFPSRVSALTEAPMDLPSDLPVRSLIDRAATGVAYDPLEAATEHAKFVHHLGNPVFLALTALGVVFGDIGTSPLYAFQVALSGLGHPMPVAAEVIGIVSLILWALIAMV